MGIMEKKMETEGPFIGIYRDYRDYTWGYMGIIKGPCRYMVYT